MNFLRQLRSVEEKGALPQDKDLKYSGNETYSSFKTRQNATKMGISSITSRPYSSVDSETKDGMTEAEQLLLDQQRFQDDATVLSIVDEPYSSNDRNAHMEHSLSSGMLKSLLSTNKTGKFRKNTISAGNKGGKVGTKSMKQQQTSMMSVTAPLPNAYSTLSMDEDDMSLLTMNSYGDKNTVDGGASFLPSSLDPSVEKGMIALMNKVPSSNSGKHYNDSTRLKNQWNSVNKVPGSSAINDADELELAQVALKTALM